jgi:hypothetical protein
MLVLARHLSRLRGFVSTLWYILPFMPFSVCPTSRIAFSFLSSCPTLSICMADWWCFRNRKRYFFGDCLFAHVGVAFTYVADAEWSEGRSIDYQGLLPQRLGCHPTSLGRGGPSSRDPQLSRWTVCLCGMSGLSWVVRAGQGGCGIPLAFEDLPTMST